MNRLTALLALILAVAPAAALADSGATPLPGTWRRLPAAPIAPSGGLASVWTGKQMLVFGRVEKRAEDGAVLSRVDVAAAYDPGADSWRRLPAPGPTQSFMDESAVWTGKEMLVWGQGTREAFNPGTGHWRRLPGSRLLSVHDGFGLVVWTGRELIGWGGGCCGDAFTDGVAYGPARNTWRPLARSPLAGSQHPIGAWTGRELLVLVGGFDPDGKPWPARLARAAAYNPATDSWRRIAPLPEPRSGASAVWDGRELLVVGGSAAGSTLPRVGFAYNPATNRWRRLPAMESGRWNFAAVWTGKRLLLWGGQGARGTIPSHGLAYDPRANRWSPLPQAPLKGRVDPAAVWTGTKLIVWGGGESNKPFHDGAAFAPATP
jgi:hypothetical protein